MSKTITVKLKKIGSRLGTFSISDNYGKVLDSSVTKDDLIKGVSFSVGDNVTVIIVTHIGKDCCDEVIKLPIVGKTRQEIVDIKATVSNTSSLWRHLTNNRLFNSFYGCTHPYVVEYPFYYEYHDEIVQNVRDYTKVYTYLPNVNHDSDYNRRLQVDEGYFNKAILYNDQQSTGTLELAAKPIGNMKAYMSYPKFKTASKEILYTKVDNFYQFNTFWNIAKNKTEPLFISSCESLSIDKTVNDSNMDYSIRSYRKDGIRGKDSKLRLVLDNRTDLHLISQLVTEGSQISYK